MRLSIALIALAVSSLGLLSCSDDPAVEVCEWAAMCSPGKFAPDGSTAECVEDVQCAIDARPALADILTRCTRTSCEPDDHSEANACMDEKVYPDLEPHDQPAAEACGFEDGFTIDL